MITTDHNMFLPIKEQIMKFFCCSILSDCRNVIYLTSSNGAVSVGSPLVTFRGSRRRRGQTAWPHQKQCAYVCVYNVYMCVCICAVLNYEARLKRLCSEHLVWFHCLRLAAGGLKQSLKLCVSVWLEKKQIETDLLTGWNNSSTHRLTTLVQMFMCFYCCFLTCRNPRSYLLLAPCLHDDT